MALSGGVVTILMIAPGLAALLKPFVKKYKPRSLENTQIHRRVSQLRRDGLVGVKEQGNKTTLYLTKAGKQMVLEYRVDEMMIPEQDPWDGKYRFVMFDIPEKKKLSRNIFRQKLIELGFKKIQNSIWRHRYPCRDQVEFLANFYEVSRYVVLVEGVATL